MVADGYKQTDIGVLPVDWDTKSYEEVFKFLTTATYSRADLSEDGAIQYLHYGDIHTKYHFILDFSKVELPKISKEQLKKYPLLNDGDIVMADASEDYAGICKSVELRGLTYEKAIAGLHTFLLRDKNNTFINGFRGYISGSSILKKQFDKLATGMKVYGVSKNNLKLVQIPIPPKPEQQAIATALSDTDELINSLEKLIAKKEAIKTGTMQELLTGKKRLDGFSGEWEEKTLGDIVNVVSGGTPSSTVASYWNGTVNWYTPTEIGKEKYVSTSVRKITLEGFKNCSAKTLPVGTILFTSRAGIGDTSILTAEGCTNQGFQSLVAKKDIDNEFVYYLVSTLTSKFLQNASGSTFLEISPNKVKEIKIFIPQYQEQQVIATILSDMDSDIEALKTKLSKVKAIKKGMMQELLTGRVRLV